MIRKRVTSSVSIAVTTGEHRPTPEAWAAYAVAYAKEGLPITMDETTTWVGVAAVGATIVKTYTVDFTRGTRMTRIADKQRDATRNASTRDALRRFLKIGGSIRYVFKSTTGEPLDAFEIDESSLSNKSLIEQAFEERCHRHHDPLQRSRIAARRPSSRRNQYH